MCYDVSNCVEEEGCTVYHTVSLRDIYTEVVSGQLLRSFSSMLQSGQHFNVCAVV